ncbi:response regulator transcription factor [Salibacterium halotolerans]|uniref:Response regulator receiver domain-containing protein n=1 Tax=Salibacterium halotolerans TaxID=1884432 RepID=A0A1I5W5T0_9BACI|nr:response regulator transcription factor [Salibacterium halotolerans]SFQ15114.1 Response regulator receiver domain-containing protein [Salibacterium halotolerans]
MSDTHMSSSIINSFNNFLQYYQASNLPCGLIIVYASLDQKGIHSLKTYLEKEEPSTAFQVSYDTEHHILGILLDDCDLGYTHFYALHVKDYLEEQNQLLGEMVVGNFPENSDHAEWMLYRMMNEMMINQRNQQEIRVFDNETIQNTDKKTILIVDHDNSILHLLTNYLQRKGYIVYAAVDGKNGLEQYQKLFPDLVITEINLSGIGGHQFINQIKTIDKKTNNHSEIMVLTNKHLEEDIKRTFEHGAAEYITKPFSLIELEARIKRLVEVTE